MYLTTKQHRADAAAVKLLRVVPGLRGVVPVTCSNSLSPKRTRRRQGCTHPRLIKLLPTILETQGSRQAAGPGRAGRQACSSLPARTHCTSSQRHEPPKSRHARGDRKEAIRRPPTPPQQYKYNLAAIPPCALYVYPNKKLLAIRTTSLSPRSPPPPPVFLSHPSFGSSELSISTSRADPSVAVVFSSSSFLTTGAREKPSLTNSCGLSSASWTYASTRSTRKRMDGRCESAPVSSISTARFFRRGPHVASGLLGRRGGCVPQTPT